MKNLGVVARVLILAFEWQREDHQKFKRDMGDPSTKHSVSHPGTMAILGSTERPCLRKTKQQTTTPSTILDLWLVIWLEDTI